MAERADAVRSIGLRELLPGARFVGADDISVQSCCGDSRACRPGDLFVALRGLRHDGLEFVPAAIRAGARGILADRPIECGIPLCIVGDVRAAYGVICQAIAGRPGQRLKVLGIAGTNGKTSTSVLLAAVLAAAGKRPGVVGTLGLYDGDEWLDSGWTTPSPPHAARALAQLADGGCTHAVLEVSSRALDESRFGGVELDVACITHVRRNEPAERIFDYLAGEGFAVLNADDDACQDYLDRFDGPAITYGLNSPAGLTATPVESGPSEQTFLLHTADETLPVRTHLIGAHNVSNCLAAAAVGLAYGLDLASVVRGLEGVQVIPGRLERLECGQPFGVYIDNAHTSDALTEVLRALRDARSGRVLCVFGGLEEQDHNRRPKVGRAAEWGSDLAVITGAVPGTGDARGAAAEILAGFHKPAAARVILDRQAAIRWTLGQARAGDSVLIAGTGDVSDKQIATDWLYNQAALLGSQAA